MMGNWWMGEFKCEGRFQSAAIGTDEWHYPDRSVTITFKRGGNTADQEAEKQGSRMGLSTGNVSGPRGRFHAAHPAQ
jgi:hypothetical protein